MIYIQKENSSINYKTDIENLSAITIILSKVQYKKNDFSIFNLFSLLFVYIIKNNLLKEQKNYFLF